MTTTIRNPIEWGADQLRLAGVAIGSAGRAVAEVERVDHVVPAARIGMGDIKAALEAGWHDFIACRTDVIYLCLLYPVVGLVLAYIAVGHGLLVLLFPLASGFALVGPIAGLGLYAMSRNHEHRGSIAWRDAFGVLSAPSFGRITILALAMIGELLVWLWVAFALYVVTLGPRPPVSMRAFIDAVWATPAGHAMAVIGVILGFVFAVLALFLFLAFPLLLDRDVGLGNAVKSSILAVWANKATMAVWGLIVAVALVLGSIPAFVGLVVVLPVLGHATWHLYRRVLPG